MQHKSNKIIFSTNFHHKNGYGLCQTNLLLSLFKHDKLGNNNIFAIHKSIIDNGNKIAVKYKASRFCRTEYLLK